MLITGGITVSEPAALFPLGSVAVMLAVVALETGKAFAVNVAELLPPGTVKLAGTDAVPLPLLWSVAVSPAGGAGPFNVTVHTELIPPVTEAGLKAIVEILAGSTVSVLPVLLAPKAAETVMLFVVATPVVIAVNVWVRLPAAMLTDVGTFTDGSGLLSETAAPPEGAAAASVTVPCAFVPPVTVAGAKARLDRPESGLTESVADALIDPFVATTITSSALLTLVVAAGNASELDPAGMVTLAGNETTAELPIRVTGNPLAGAIPLSVMVPVEVWLPATLAGENASAVITGGRMVSAADALAPFRDALMLAVAWLETAAVAIPKVAAVPPAGTVTVAGTEANALLLASLTDAPPEAAGLDRVTVPFKG